MDERLRRWRKERYEPAIARQPERLARFVTESGLSVEPMYGPGDAAGAPAEYPGEYPFTRGVHPTMHRGRLWTMRQYAGYSTPEETNERFRYLLAQGQTGLSVAFDLPTQTGYDSDHDLAEGEVGKVGTPVCSLADMEALLRGIPLDRVSTSMTINATAPVLLALYAAVARKQGVPLERLSGTVQNDVLKEYVARGTYIYPPGPSLRLAVDLAAFCAERMPRWNPISVSGYHMREAGATAVQEVAFTLANAIAYVEAAAAAGMDAARFAERASFFFAAHNHLFEEVAKFRAARRLWATIVRERFGIEDERACMLRFHAQTAGVTLTAQQPEVNSVRTAIQALAAALGGAQSLHVNARDEALGLPTEESAALALRAQQVLAHESGAADTADPLGGAYFVEHLTSEIEGRARAYLERIDALGGAVAAIEAGFQQGEIAEAAYRHLRAVESGERAIVGVNVYAEEEAPAPPLTRLDPARAEAQKERVRQARRSRDEAQAQAALSRLVEAARGTDNTMPAILECVEAYATLGEISDALRSVFGAHAARGGG